MNTNTQPHDEQAALAVLQSTGINILEAALLAREALNTGRGRLRRARRCLQAGDEALRLREKTVCFCTAVEEALEARACRRPRTISDLRYITRRFLKRCPGLARRRIRSISSADCILYLRRAFSTPRQRNKARLALSCIFTTAIRRGWCTDNPVRNIEPEPIQEKRIDILTRDQIERLLHTAATHRRGECLPAVGLMLYAGVRPHEVERLTWSQIQLDRGIIRILPQHSKTGGARQVTIYPPLAAILHKIDEMGLRKGTYVCPPAWRRHWTKLHQLAGWTGGKRWVEDVLRHTFASHHLVNFRSYAELQLEMGHRSAELLRTRYVAMEGVRREDNFWLTPAIEA